MYDVEALHVKQRKILQEIYEYVCGAASKKDLYGALRMICSDTCSKWGMRFCVRLLPYAE